MEIDFHVFIRSSYSPQSGGCIAGNFNVCFCLFNTTINKQVKTKGLEWLTHPQEHHIRSFFIEIALYFHEHRNLVIFHSVYNSKLHLLPTNSPSLIHKRIKQIDASKPRVDVNMGTELWKLSLSTTSDLELLN